MTGRRGAQRGGHDGEDGAHHQSCRGTSRADGDRTVGRDVASDLPGRERSRPSGHRDTGVKVAALTPQQGVTGLATAMVRLARDPAMRARKARASRLRVEEHFSWEKTGEAWARIYEQVVREDAVGTRRVKSLSGHVG